jgi:cytochrome b-561
MASNPEQRPSNGVGFSEREPLLGGPGDALQREGQSFLNNLVIGTGLIAEIAVILLVALVWIAVLTKPVNLFSGHPVLQVFAIFILVQSVLTLQPTHTAEQKRAGRWIHASLNLVALLSLIGGIFIIEYNKGLDPKAHFHSVHGYLGVATSVVLILQYLVGFGMWVTPSLFGGEENAKSIWKYHRLSGYFVLVLLLATVCSASKTPYIQNVIKIELWSTVLLSILILVGIFPRIQKQKLGYRPATGN